MIQGLVERGYKMYAEEFKTYEEIAEALHKEGYVVSCSGVGRAIRSRAKQVKEYKKAAEQVKELLKEVKNTPGLDIAEGANQMALVNLFREVLDRSNLSELGTADVLRLVANLTHAQARIAMVRMEYNRGWRDGAEKAAKEAAIAAKKAGLSGETAAAIESALIKDIAGLPNG
ncbi:phage protein Gp27 family protein [Treponema endosymbiont of Eucomonympha sp.]|uniref:phage protein Gp27 family protein n=1 Tax=Treponema endosymbiont of Eucomonympha sp. TaxID=1580831 RepID=UPI000751511A|nr:phage protein Gp27 family protein [Treponema endosymbiont of Eucomonympha sp.]